jgi:hypothetical protein
MGEGSSDPLAEAAELVDAAGEQGIPIRMVGGLAIRYLCPDFPPRAREGQDLDLASTSGARKEVTRFLTERGFVPDKEFNNLYGQRQLYFTTPDGSRGVDVLLDQVTMCHVLAFRDRIDRMPQTLDITDLLLSKLQIVELNEKDLQDVLYLLAAYPVAEGDEAGTIGLARVGKVLGEDWGWWRTVTANLDRVAKLPEAGLEHLLPPNPPHDPVAQAERLRHHADTMPKSLKWKLRSKVGDRVQWYQLPEEVAHP